MIPIAEFSFISHEENGEWNSAIYTNQKDWLKSTEEVDSSQSFFFLVLPYLV